MPLLKNLLTGALFLLFVPFAVFAADSSPPANPAPLRVLIAGLVHGHVSGFLDQYDPKVIQIVGVLAEDPAVWNEYQGRAPLAGVPHYTDLATAVTESKPGAVWAFSDTRGHLEIVRAAAPHHLAVIVEKPLAVSYAAATEMEALAKRYHSLVLTNYETSWYPSFEEARLALGANGPLGTLRQIFVQDGHQGPVLIKVQPEFLAWLRDPARAGAGALFDFGCYGVNLATWWLGNRAPDQVSAHTSQFDRVNYPNCDDHATIELIYPDVRVICVGSWHWPYSRKDAALYGDQGAFITSGDVHYTLRTREMKGPEAHEAQAPRRNPYQWFAQTIRAGRDPVEDPSSLVNNLIVMRVLEAAKRSAADGRTISLHEITAGP